MKARTNAKTFKVTEEAGGVTTTLTKGGESKAIETVGEFQEKILVLMLAALAVGRTAVAELQQVVQGGATIILISWRFPSDPRRIPVRNDVFSAVSTDSATIMEGSTRTPDAPTEEPPSPNYQPPPFVPQAPSPKPQQCKEKQKESEFSIFLQNLIKQSNYSNAQSHNVFNFHAYY
jgi:hypothetical protein